MKNLPSYRISFEILACVLVLDVDDIMSFGKAASIKVVKMTLTLFGINVKSIARVSLLGAENAACCVINDIGHCLDNFCQHFRSINICPCFVISVATSSPFFIRMLVHIFIQCTDPNN